MASIEQNNRILCLEDQVRDLTRAVSGLQLQMAELLRKEPIIHTDLPIRTTLTLPKAKSA